jgi:hypothetical protein
MAAKVAYDEVEIADLEIYGLAHIFEAMRAQFKSSDNVPSLTPRIVRFIHEKIEEKKVPHYILKWCIVRMIEQRMPIVPLMVDGQWKTVFTINDRVAKMTIQQMLNLFECLFTEFSRYNQRTLYSTHFHVDSYTVGPQGRIVAWNAERPVHQIYSYETLECLGYVWCAGIKSAGDDIVHRNLDEGPAHFCTDVIEEYKSITIFAENNIITNREGRPCLIIVKHGDGGLIRIYATPVDGQCFKMEMDTGPYKSIELLPETGEIIKTHIFDNVTDIDGRLDYLMHMFTGTLVRIIWRNDSISTWQSSEEFCTVQLNGDTYWYRMKQPIKYPALLNDHEELITTTLAILHRNTFALGDDDDEHLQSAVHYAAHPEDDEYWVYGKQVTADWYPTHPKNPIQSAIDHKKNKKSRQYIAGSAMPA